MGTPEGFWDIWIDTGGTFTDCIARDATGAVTRVKVLSSSALRGRVTDSDDSTLRYEAAWAVPDGFLVGASLVALADNRRVATVAASSGNDQRLTLDGALDWTVGETFEARFDLEPPVLAAHLATGCSPTEPLPATRMRLATTRATNALLEHAGAPVAFFTTVGFGDLLRIGDQRRPDLFALDIERPRPLYDHVYEVEERLRANGDVLRPLNEDALATAIDQARSMGIESAAVALLNSYRNPRHEQRVEQALRRAGFAHVSISSSVSPTPKIVPRAETTVVNAYLAPTLESYLARVEAAVTRGGGSLHVLTSAGGLERASGYQPKDSLLSGPAGGVVGATDAGRACGFQRVLAFDMGGTSTDVSRSDGDPTFRFEHRVGDARVAAPALAIETVAAGGGSVCRVVDGRLRVGPESAGAHPGPACYGVGGPLTLTDVNLLLGRLDPQRIGIPLTPDAADRALVSVQRTLGQTGTTMPSREVVLEGCRTIANERMADAIRRISIYQGEDPRDCALVAFGGAGGQHACAVAEHLGISVVVLPPDAGLLSARGLGAASIERLARRPILRPLATVSRALPRLFAALAREATRAVLVEGVASESIQIRQQRVAVRLTGQESTLDVPYREGQVAADFQALYRATYGYRPPRRALEVTSIQTLAVSVEITAESVAAAVSPVLATAATSTRAEPVASIDGSTFLQGAWHRVQSFDRLTLEPGDVIEGPASIFDAHASLFVEPGWTARRVASGAIVARRATPFVRPKSVETVPGKRA